jgi:O-antigen ligase
VNVPFAPPLPRADASREAGAPPPLGTPDPKAHGLSTFASTSLRRLPVLTWALLAYLFLVASAADEEWKAIGAWRPRLVLGAFLLGGVLLRALDPRERAAHPLADRTLLRRLLAFLVAGTISAVLAFDPALAEPAQVENAVRAAAFVLVALVLRTRREVALAVLALVLGHGFHLLRSATEYLAGRHQFTMGVRRMLGAGTSYADPNSFAATVVLAFPLVLWAARESRSRLLRLAAAAYGVVGAGCVVLTHSRAGLVLLLLAAVWTLAVLPGRARIVVAVVLAALAAKAASGLTENEAKRFLGLLTLDETLERDESAHGRVEGYEVSWRIFEEHPVLGVGPGCWAAYRQQRVDGNRHDPHNLVGQLLATRGLAGFLTFAAYALGAVAIARRERRARRGSADPYDRAVRGLGGVLLVTFALLFVSGLAAHNLDRPAWYLLPGLLVALLGARAEPVPADGGAR